jgi:hypothetical protein
VASQVKNSHELLDDSPCSGWHVASQNKDNVQEVLRFDCHMTVKKLTEKIRVLVIVATPSSVRI